MTLVTFNQGGWNIMDSRMMRELARQISGVDTIAAAVTGRRPVAAEHVRATEEPSQPEPEN